MKRYVIKRPTGPNLPDRLARYREELNEEQFAVATAPVGASLVIAGAGSGKTRAITYRVAYLVEHGVAPARIMLATFTNRAAREMLRRVEQLTGGGSDVARRVWGGTFHRIANLILRRHAESLGYTSNFSILDSEDAKDFLSVCVDEAGVVTKARRFHADADWRRLHDFDALDASRVKVPTLLMIGQLDPFYAERPAAQAERFVRLGTADKEWVVLAGGDHAALIERPAPRFVQAIASFLERPTR